MKSIHDFAPLLATCGYCAQTLEASEEVPYNHLVVQLNADYNERYLQLEMMNMPKIDETEVLQYFVLLPYRMKKSNVNDLARFVHILNEQLPIAGFGIKEENSWVYFRHLSTLMSDEIDGMRVINLIEVLSYFISRFGQILEEVAEGASLDRGRALLQLNLLNWQPG